MPSIKMTDIKKCASKKQKYEKMDIINAPPSKYEILKKCNDTFMDDIKCSCFAVHHYK